MCDPEEILGRFLSYRVGTYVTLRVSPVLFPYKAILLARISLVSSQVELKRTPLSIAFRMVGILPPSTESSYILKRIFQTSIFDTE